MQNFIHEYILSMCSFLITNRPLSGADCWREILFLFEPHILHSILICLSSSIRSKPWLVWEKIKKKEILNPSFIIEMLYFDWTWSMRDYDEMDVSLSSISFIFFSRASYLQLRYYIWSPGSQSLAIEHEMECSRSFV